MSERLMRIGAAAVLSSALWLCAVNVSAQSAREELGAHIDSLADEYDRKVTIVNRLDSIAAARVLQIRTDTVVVGPFLIIDRDTVDVTGVAEALDNAWSVHAARVGVVAERIYGVVVTLTLGDELMDSGAARRVYPFEPFVTGRADFPRAAERLVSNVLTAALPEDVRYWLGGAVLQQSGRRDWIYRELATTGSEAGRDCFHDDERACLAALGLGDTLADGAGLSLSARATLLAHALDTGGAGSYARLFADTPYVTGRLANAAGHPIDEVVAGWRESVQAERPDIHAGVGRAGFWTLAWLAGLALIAMRSTRWRLG